MQRFVDCPVATRTLVAVMCCAVFGHAKAAATVKASPGQCCREGNLAFQKNAVATSEQSGRGNLAKNATDGDLRTRWCVNGSSAPESLTIDLDEAKDIRWLRIHWENAANAYRYTVDSSPDSQAWSTCVDASTNEKPGQVVAHEVDVKGARYLRVTFLGASKKGWGSLWECEAYEKELPPLPPAAEANAVSPREVKAPEGFDVTVFATPPEVPYPVCLTTSPTGEIYVGIDEQGSLGKTPGGGRVVRCVDVDGDGQADRFNTFAQVDHPRGLIYDNHRLWVLHPPTLSLFIDHDRDGVADEQKTLISGISTDQVNKRGADHTTNGIRMGIDGWIYIAVGDFGFNAAQGADGREMRRRGGGVVRVRPDGSDMEIYCWGLRNILDVCIDPNLNIFTRDNTNDGGGWNVRFTHLHQGGNYGYPSKYIHFADETLPPLAGYGGGSGCGGLFHHDPRWPSGYESAVLTCDWGTSKVYRHRPKAAGATFEPDQDVFLSLPRPTDIDVDPSGRMFVSSWKNGSYKYSGPDVGFVAMVQPRGFVAKPLPALGELTPAQLVALMPMAGSATLLHVQQELLRRDAGDTSELLTALLENEAADMPARVAALFTLKQMQGSDANGWLAAMAFEPGTMQEMALRALTDRMGEIPRVDVDKVIATIESKNPRVRAQALVSARRLAEVDRLSQADRARLTKAVLPLSVVRNSDGSLRTQHVPHHQADEPRVIPVLAVETLIALDSVSTLIEATEGDLRDGALRALRQMHSKDVVDAALAKLAKTHDAPPRLEWLELLACLHFREGEYVKGDWWGTRPDTRGPSYDRKTWEQSDRIKQVLVHAHAGMDIDAKAALASMLERYRLSLGERDLAKLESLETDKPIEVAKADPKNPDQIGNLERPVAVARASETKGNAEAGKALFVSQSCVACHTYADGQTPQGPHLVDIGKRYSRRELVESVLDPSAKIAQGFDTWTVLTDGGKAHTGFVVLESAETVTLRGADGRRVEIPQDDIDERHRQEQSMMPAGLVDALTPEQLADLLAYIESLH